MGIILTPGQESESVFIKKGAIIAWDIINPVPDGWLICDGENGTPDLKSKFLKESVIYIVKI